MMEHPVTSPRTYFFVYVVLLVLLGATIGVAYLDLGIFNTLAAVSIATLKAVLVILFFMHVRYSSRVVRVYALAGFVWLLHLIFWMLTDYLARPGF